MEQLDEHILESEYALKLYEKLGSEMRKESDRGALLLSAEIASQALLDEISRLRPAYFTQKQIDTLFDYSGFLGSLSARIHHAAFQGILLEGPYRALNILRKLRNKAAHSDSKFSLSDNTDQIKSMFDLGLGSHAALRKSSLEALLDELYSNLRALGETYDFENPFDTREKLANILQQRPQSLEKLQNNLEKFELAVGIWIILVGLHAQTDKIIDLRKQASRA
ncbi:hypothetical protein [Hyphomonas sp.]|uniref:hypothetical protein n=1 Tax=Hyphomonas sp. TaxID=87 RepID=UPI003241CD46